MVAELTVVEATAAPTPEPVGEISLVDFSFGLPTDGLAAAGTYRVRNAGPSDHELAIMRLRRGRHAGRRGRLPAGGLHRRAAVRVQRGSRWHRAGATRAWSTSTSRRARYLAMCFLPDEATGKRHAELGMVTAFTVP